MTKYLITAIAVLALALFGSVYALKRQVGSAAVLKAQVESLVEAQDRAAERRKKDRAALVAREAKIASQARKLADAQQALSEALQHEKDWSDTDVPPAVQKALSGRSGDPDPASPSLRHGADGAGSPKP